MSDLTACVATLVSRPFRNQVGGHTALGRLRDSDGRPVIAKPVSDRERDFYSRLLQLAPALARYVPACSGFGVVALSPATAVPVPPSAESRGLTIDAISRSLSVEVARPTYTMVGSPAIRSHDLTSNYQDATQTVVAASGSASDSASPILSSSNPWAARCLEKLAVADARPCILLEDLTAGFALPCVLDIKMGTRLHGPDVSSEKRTRADAKSRKTTSAALGLRLCGMQVYVAEHNTFLCHDKYVGRNLTAGTVGPELAWFFGLGPSGAPPSPRMKDILDGIVGQLEHLAAVVATLSGFRFFSSSLLIIYEGDCNRSSPSFDVRMIDFAHTALERNLSGSETYDGPDMGQLLGLNNLIRLIKCLMEA